MFKLKESAEFTEVKGGTARIRLIRAGQGSSGFYSPELLERCGSAAFPKGTFLYFNHKDPAGRDIRDAFGATISETSYDAEDQSLWADADIFTTHREFISEIAKYADLSIEAAGEKDDDGNVTEILPNPFNAVALVPRGGREGKIAEIMESAEYGSVINNENQRKDAGMTPEDIQKIVEALVAAITPEFAKITEALKPADDQDKEVVQASDVAEALIAANLPKSARTRVYSAVQTGTKLEEAVKAEADYITELREDAQKDEQNRVKGSADNYDFSVAGW